MLFWDWALVRTPLNLSVGYTCSGSSCALHPGDRGNPDAPLTRPHAPSATLTPTPIQATQAPLFFPPFSAPRARRRCTSFVWAFPPQRPSRTRLAEPSPCHHHPSAHYPRQQRPRGRCPLRRAGVPEPRPPPRPALALYGPGAPHRDRNRRFSRAPHLAVLLALRRKRLSRYDIFTAVHRPSRTWRVPRSLRWNPILTRASCCAVPPQSYSAVFAAASNAHVDGEISARAGAARWGSR